MNSSATDNVSSHENSPSLASLNEQLRATVGQKDEKIQALEYQLNWFKRQLFCKKSEKRDMADNSLRSDLEASFYGR